MRIHLLLVLGLICLPMVTFAQADCITEASPEMEINLSSGVYTERAAVSSPLKIRIPTGLNHATYGACLQIQGVRPAEEMTTRVARMGQCQHAAHHTRIVPATQAAPARIVSAVDESQTEACLEHDIDVEVLAPAATN